MENLSLNIIREKFLSFYASKEHYRRGSFPLIPQNDKSLLIINSGMAPLKPYFAGLIEPPAKRMTTCQKCIRTADIENVGITSRHGTFFEMLGSFSFGDYFKKESISWGWEFITEVLEMPTDNIWVTVYEDDDDAYNIWKNHIHFPEEKIVRLGKDDNFWEIGTGPCGPCSEIYYDRGEEYGCGNEDCKPGCECDRFIEFWNHVFTQFNKEEDGSYSDLAHPNIDTGMGLERLACIMQNVDSIFDVDTIKFVLDEVCKIANIKYHDGKAPEDISIRIITDHVRSATFMIGDKIMPGNEGRGYVLRRLIRRAIRHGRKLGIEGPFLSTIVDKVIDISGGAYVELEKNRDFIEKIVTIEEEKFMNTLNQGLSIIDEYIKELKESGLKELPGLKAFKLHDTYGFPFEITSEILEESGMTVSKDEFNKYMSEQKELGKKDAAESDVAWKEGTFDFMYDEKTTFTGYEKAVDHGVARALFKNRKTVTKLKVGDTGSIAFDITPFYARMGGQESDTGIIYNDNFKAEVIEVTKFKNVFIHKIVVEKGCINIDDDVEMVVYTDERHSSARNHTATHILHKALKSVLGEHVEQAGSSVSPTSLRFDFNHFEAMTEKELAEVEKIVNEVISDFLEVKTEELSLKEAAKTGAIGLFTDKYGDVVRVVSVGNYSKELCGGIHVENSGQIGAFKIISESGIASGIRRIEAITGFEIYNRLKAKEYLVDKINKDLKTNDENIISKVASLIEENKSMKKELEYFNRMNLNNLSEDLMSEAKEINGRRIITKLFKDKTIDDLKTISDELKAKEDNLVLVLATENGGKTTIIVSMTKDLIKDGLHAGKMIKEIAKAAGGGGGGKPDMAQAGAKDATKIKDAFKVAENLL